MSSKGLKKWNKNCSSRNSRLVRRSHAIIRKLGNELRFEMQYLFDLKRSKNDNATFGSASVSDEYVVAKLEEYFRNARKEAVENFVALKKQSNQGSEGIMRFLSYAQKHKIGLSLYHKSQSCRGLEWKFVTHLEIAKLGISSFVVELGGGITRRRNYLESQTFGPEHRCYDLIKSHVLVLPDPNRFLMVLSGLNFLCEDLVGIIVTYL